MTHLAATVDVLMPFPLVDPSPKPEAQVTLSWEEYDRLLHAQEQSMAPHTSHHATSSGSRITLLASSLRT